MSDQRRTETTDEKLPHPTNRNCVWLFIQVVLRAFFALWLKYRARGAENVPRDGGGLVIANHQSFLDPLLVAAPFERPISYVARDTLFPVPIIGWILRKTYVMPINRSAASTASIHRSVQRVEHGFLVGIFPEGTRTRDGSVGEFKPGFVSLIRRSRAAVYPVGIAGAFEAYPKGVLFPRRQQVCVVYGEPLDPDRLQELSKKGREHELIAFAREHVQNCQREAENWRHQLTSRWLVARSHSTVTNPTVTNQDDSQKNDKIQEAPT